MSVSTAAASPPSSFRAATFPYMGPAHDPQKLMRASLASSCLRGQMFVWQFQDGSAGNALARMLAASAEAERAQGWLLRAGHYHRFMQMQEGTERVQDQHQQQRRDTTGRRALASVPVGMLRFSNSLCDALTLGHVEMAEALMLGDARFNTAALVSRRVIGMQSAFVSAPIVRVFTGAVRADWGWGIRHMLDATESSNVPRVQATWRTGRFLMAFLVAAARAGTPRSLHWVEHLRDAHERLMTRRAAVDKSGDEAEQPLPPRDRILNCIVGECTLAVAEYIASTFPPSPPPGDVFDQICSAVRGGNAEVLEWLLRMHADLRWPDSSTFNLMDAAAAVGSLPTLLVLHNDAHDFGRCTNALDAAVEHGSMDMLRWAVANVPRDTNAPDSMSNAMNTAALAGRLDMVEHMVSELGASCTSVCTSAAAVGGALNVLEWAALQPAFEPPPSIDPAVRCGANGVGAVRVLEWLSTHVPELPCSAAALDDAAALPEAQAVHTVEWLARNRPHVQCTALAFLRATTCGKLRLLRLLRALYPTVEFPEDILAQAAVGGHEEVVRWLYHQPGGRGPAGTVPIPIPVTRVAERGHVGVLRFWRETCPNDPPPADDLLVTAILAEQTAVVEFLVSQHVCRVDDRELARLAEPESLVRHFLERQWRKRRENLHTASDNVGAEADDNADDNAEDDDDADDDADDDDDGSSSGQRTRRREQQRATDARVSYMN